ncbi:hypothetical protein RA279_30385, partial [Pseudomonas syringae pv. tagetis]|uniref:hypothetical protein n=1 Tax=Pseudomonas syringae group genomosp. 7 TaxID=251699 RepID=UPI00376F7797
WLWLCWFLVLVWVVGWGCLLGCCLLWGLGWSVVLLFWLRGVCEVCGLGFSLLARVAADEARVGVGMFGGVALGQLY